MCVPMKNGYSSEYIIMNNPHDSFSHHHMHNPSIRQDKLQFRDYLLAHPNTVHPKNGSCA